MLRRKQNFKQRGRKRGRFELGVRIWKDLIKIKIRSGTSVCACVGCVNIILYLALRLHFICFRFLFPFFP